MSEHLRIYSRCPACESDTLTVSDHHLLCTWVDCPDPTLAHRVAKELATLRTRLQAAEQQRDEALFMKATLIGQRDTEMAENDSLRAQLSAAESALATAQADRDELAVKLASAKDRLGE